MVQNLTLKDCEGLEVKSNHPWDILVAVAGKALEIYEESKKTSTSARKKLQLPEEFTRAIQETAGGGRVSQVRLVIEKSLTISDVKPNQNRLLMPIRQISDEFLNEEEKNRIGGKDGEGRKIYMNVRIIEPSLQRGDSVRFGRWDMSKSNGKSPSSNYVINGNWMKIVNRNRLREEMVVQVWSFRIGEELCFALVKLP
ncbi:hypothetical protein ACS0TY_027950 [Phlomoides rotata]